MKSFAKKLAEAGELVSAERLAGPDQAKRVRAGEDARRSLWRLPPLRDPAVSR